MNHDLRNKSEDESPRILNAIEPGTVMPIYIHYGNCETVVCTRGHFEEYLYGYTETRSDGTPDPDSFGLIESIDMYPGDPILNIEKGQWHSLKCLESGTILLESKDGVYEPLGPEDIMELPKK